MTATMDSRLSAMASRTFTRQRAKDTARALGPVLLALSISPIAAHAQGTGDVSGVTSALKTIETSCLLSGALAVAIGIVFGIFQFMGRNISGFMTIGGGLFGELSSVSRRSGFFAHRTEPLPSA